MLVCVMRSIATSSTIYLRFLLNGCLIIVLTQGGKRSNYMKGWKLICFTIVTCLLYSNLNIESYSLNVYNKTCNIKSGSGFSGSCSPSTWKGEAWAA